MLILHATTDIIRVVTGSAADIEPAVSLMETDNSVPPVVQDIPNLGPLASITTATTTTIADCTTANRRRNVKHISLYNNHATQATTCRVEFSDGTLVAVLANVNLLAGEMLVFTQGGVWLHYDSNGAVYPSVGNAASVAEMEAGTATDKYVAPGTQHRHPGHPKCWGVVTVAAGAPTLQANYNLTSITDTATGDIVFTVATDFSSVNWCCQHSVEIITGAFAVATVRDSHVKFGTLAAGTVSLQCIDKTATTNLLKDPQSWHMTGYGDQA
jgi:hypothetical protein